MIFLILFLLVFAFWIYAENRNLSFFSRLGSGIACMTFIGLAIAFVSQIIPSYEHNFHKTAMKQMEQVLTNGDTPSVLRALHAYNGIAVTGSTYSAVIEMKHVLYSTEKP